MTDYLHIIDQHELYTTSQNTYTRCIHFVNAYNVFLIKEYELNNKEITFFFYIWAFTEDVFVEITSNLL